MSSHDSSSGAPPVQVSRLRRIMQRIWWLHSFFALGFGVVVMAFARKGLAHADKVLIALGASWMLIFIAFRFIVGPANRKTDERIVKKGVRLVTNYVIKQMYQQMFFFLVPLYASSAMWSLDSPNWWIVPLLLLCAVLSTMDLVFDNFIMEHRVIAAGMYGLCMFSVLNLLLPLSLHVPHFVALMVAAVITPAGVALLSYPLKSVFSSRGIALVSLCTVILAAGCFTGRQFVPAAPMAMPAGGIGHGNPGAYECVPGPLRETTSDRLDGLRCVSEISEPGGINDDIVHVWVHQGEELARVSPSLMGQCRGNVFRSKLSSATMPADPTGRWSCRIETEEGQLVGLRSFRVKAPAAQVTLSPEVLRDAAVDASPQE
ncbi:MAG: DUF2914 domain-containing protein [Myxococcales bacterium]|nr:DUF2914 domain-containing protein [Myxococcales bacterium]